MYVLLDSDASDDTEIIHSSPVIYATRIQDKGRQNEQKTRLQSNSFDAGTWQWYVVEDVGTRCKELIETPSIGSRMLPSYTPRQHFWQHKRVLQSNEHIETPLHPLRISPVNLTCG